MQLIISSVFPSGLSCKGRRHSARPSLVSRNLTATCHETVQERSPRADLGRLEKQFVRCCRLSPLLLGRIWHFPEENSSEGVAVG